ncbi:cytochrome c oxidase subunit 6a, mitochondrial-like [Prosopis cineraria]|uniref:cytochrome c oxidase subunit 6a, mitochondrial-like n=1 Tax=Prosopis cineraria TaxID=364024 RepID=UPI0024109AF1|nr:cytochrome c oxidase subunit 6a, mitochondrial-like [Prosopis cineraria]
MATALVRSTLLRTALRGGGRGSAVPSRNFASSAHHDDAYETAKWEKITYLGIATCTVLSIYNLSRSHHYHEEPPGYPYLHIRNKEFPWGPDGLFEVKH